MRNDHAHIDIFESSLVSDRRQSDPDVAMSAVTAADAQQMLTVAKRRNSFVDDQGLDVQYGYSRRIPDLSLRHPQKRNGFEPIVADVRNGVAGKAIPRTMHLDVDALAIRVNVIKVVAVSHIFGLVLSDLRAGAKTNADFG